MVKKEKYLCGDPGRFATRISCTEDRFFIQRYGKAFDFSSTEAIWLRDHLNDWLGEKEKSKFRDDGRVRM